MNLCAEKKNNLTCAPHHKYVIADFKLFRNGDCESNENNMYPSLFQALGMYSHLGVVTWCIFDLFGQKGKVSRDSFMM